jgi:hypothetical protein
MTTAKLRKVVCVLSACAVPRGGLGIDSAYARGGGDGHMGGLEVDMEAPISVEAILEAPPRRKGHGNNNSLLLMGAAHPAVSNCMRIRSGTARSLPRRSSLWLSQHMDSVMRASAM